MQTKFPFTVTLRVSKDECQKDKFTEKEIVDKLKSGEACFDKGQKSSFVVLKTNNNQIMAEVIIT